MQPARLRPNTHRFEPALSELPYINSGTSLLAFDAFTQRALTDTAQATLERPADRTAPNNKERME
ncbi:hypothetical protein GCM10009504_23840 [Pseudomonas laurentiana]|nr:hypothetical protein GCM10009504_23840 [Pseudomonas laurentiana]